MPWRADGSMPSPERYPIVKTRLSCLAALLLVAACSDKAPPAESAAAQSAPAGTLPLVINSGGKAHRLTVEAAITPEQQAQGLMFRTSLPADGGMLFPMTPPRTASFWMKNTVIPLDMLFIRTDGSIAMIAANTTPYAREPVSAGIPVAAVLELRGGRAAELDVKEGDRVAWGACAVPEVNVEASLQAVAFCP
ncbi:DUF192 domain-containing protein [Sphingobium algorifonticola]|uniref:DUF192 domain-containing protein n=1 Tax=Sphingobium algorifonticola TaxID=2008318 RepID=UPI00268BE308